MFNSLVSGITVKPKSGINLKNVTKLMNLPKRSLWHPVPFKNSTKVKNLFSPFPEGFQNSIKLLTMNTSIFELLLSKNVNVSLNFNQISCNLIF